MTLNAAIPTDFREIITSTDPEEVRWHQFRVTFDPAEYDVEPDGYTLCNHSPLRRATDDDVPGIHRAAWDAGLLCPEDADRDWLSERFRDPFWLSLVGERRDIPSSFGFVLARGHLDADGNLAVRATLSAGNRRMGQRLITALVEGASDFGLGFSLGPIGFAEIPPSHRDGIHEGLHPIARADGPVPERLGMTRRQYLDLIKEHLSSALHDMTADKPELAPLSIAVAGSYLRELLTVWPPSLFVFGLHSPVDGSVLLPLRPNGAEPVACLRSLVAPYWSKPSTKDGLGHSVGAAPHSVQVVIDDDRHAR
jgi:hypothetical protein